VVLLRNMNNKNEHSLYILRLREILKETYVDILFYIIAFAAIGIFIGIRTAVFLLLFLGLFALVSYSALGIYNAIRGVREKWLLLKIAGSILTGTIIYLVYGSDALLRAVSLALVITTITLFLVKFYKPKEER
jgi:predicted neutral ceramidase superfamily lipid hydrolase